MPIEIAFSLDPCEFGGSSGCPRVKVAQFHCAILEWGLSGKQGASGHDFSRANRGREKGVGFSPGMSKPSRPSVPANASGRARQFFVTSKTAVKALLQTDRMASLFVDVLRTYTQAGRFVVHEFVVMPDHVHILLTVPGDKSLERTVQLIKGNFSFRAKKELGFQGEVWQRGFSDVRIATAESFRLHRFILTRTL